MGLPPTASGEPVHITTGRRLPSTPEAVAATRSSCSTARRPSARPRGPVTDLWGANLGTDDEVVISGPVEQVADEINAAREECKRRAGWVMDIYLLRSPDVVEGT